MNEKDPEKTTPPAKFQHRWVDSPIGYPRLSERIAIKPETGIYRKFSALNARNILYMQAELCGLERALRGREKIDSADEEWDRCKYAVDFEYMLEAPHGIEKAQLDMINKLRKKLRQYNKALIQQATLQNMTSPDYFDINDVRSYLFSNEMGGGKMIGEDRCTWGSLEKDDDYAVDLVSVVPRQHVDKFSTWVAENAIHLFRFGLGRLKKADRLLGPHVYYDSSVLKLTFAMTSILASLLPLGSIWALKSLHSTGAKLGTIAGFTVFTTLCLTVMTEAKRTDVFGITAAFVAIQVVFLSTTECPCAGPNT